MKNILDKNCLAKELQFLLFLIQCDNHRSLEDKVYYTDFDWDYFLQLVYHHRLYPLVYVNLKKIGYAVPGSVLEELKNKYQQNTFRMLNFCSEMERVIHALELEGIRTLMLKGPVLSESLYGDLSMRTSKDLDILIPIDELDHVRESLIKLGYSFKQDLPPVLNEWKWRWHHISGIHQQNGIQIEVHWRLSHDSGNEPSFDELWSRKRRSTQTRSPVYFLGSEDLFMYLITHGARHGWYRLRWLVDIDKMLIKGINEDNLILLLNKYKSRQLAGQALILLSLFFNRSISGKFEPLMQNNHSRRLARYAFDFINNMVVMENSEPSAKYQLSLKTWLQKVNFLIRRMHPDSLDRNLLHLPKQLFFLYFLFRPFLWVIRKLKTIPPQVKNSNS
ncbi:nucleotidyltransferase domain-containing protein [Paenibacillus cineris]|uniref:nucleotidyltransferase domain-containing protein n=1 Tax=Paenibacillus cineris TaxID=237530 RepID=UPI001BB3CF6E|nr:nucleotidyltransferase family protein [Paenibacillus cineris]